MDFLKEGLKGQFLRRREEVATLEKGKIPKRVAAAKKAWETIRAKAKGKQATNKLDQNPLN